MTEAEWLVSTDPQAMLDQVEGAARPRQLRLFACACCRRIWHLLSFRGWHAVEVAERFADGLAKGQALAAASKACGDSWTNALTVGDVAAHAAAADNVLFAANSAATNARYSPLDRAAKGAERLAQCVLIRDVFGNQFCPVEANLSWLLWHEATVVKIAQIIYDEHAFDRLPLLADALEEAGCTNAAILDHCRGSGPHVRGCWVVDLLLGKK